MRKYFFYRWPVIHCDQSQIVLLYRRDHILAKSGRASVIKLFFRGRMLLSNLRLHTYKSDRGEAVILRFFWSQCLLGTLKPK